MRFNKSLENATKMQRAGALYVKGSSLRQAAKTTGVSYSGLRKWLVAHDVDRRPPGRHLDITKNQVKELIKFHQTDHRSLRELAKETGHDRGAIALAIRRAGYMTYSARDMRHLLQQRRDKDASEKILGMYKDGFPIKEIAAHLHSDARRVRRVVKGGKNA